MDFQKYFKNFYYQSSDFPLFIQRKKVNTSPILPLHWHQDLQFTLCLKGNIVLRLEDMLVSLQENNILFINHHILHQIIEMSPDAEYIEIDFSEQLISFFPGSAMFKKCVKPYTHSSNLVGFLLKGDTDWEKEIKEYIKILYQFQQTTPTQFFEYQSTIYLTQMWLLICKYINEEHIISSNIEKDKQHLVAIQSMLGFIYENYQEKIDLKDIACNGHVSTAECSRLFKSFTNQSPYHFLMNYRLQTSLHYLINHPELNISDISQIVGFNQTSNFIQKFTEKFGQTPHR